LGSFIRLEFILSLSKGSRFFVIANDVKQSVELFYNRNDKKSSTQAGLQLRKV
jgi:hypothetical protein